MTVLKKIVGFVFKAIAGLIILIAVFAASLTFFSRQERAKAKDFLQLLGSGSYAEAHAMFSEDVQREFPLSRMQVEFQNYQPYSDIWFSSVQISNGLTTISGEATTEGDCTSKVEFSFKDELIVGFHIPKPCLKNEISA